ncbi:hypothetical protein [Fructilactobacillus fructivorans]|nr:hypothetical protein [Fructilactobacillus fructivorans]MCT0151034.1 hypothetical protein [Fructilactobacillus fructivorans]MCT2867408.1 hypothetical protein [Fructilactobacillus fructivorans]MCT2869073.1 hypothetical protein [Fructilactobacillus fructivorans]MCT2873207.1 hypothetical protein [Fructilactobacillus fructivorans]
MHIILLRHPAKLVHLEYANLDNVVLISPKSFKKDNDEFFYENHNRPNEVYVDQWNLKKLVTVMREISLKHSIDSVSTLAEEDIEMVALLREFFLNTKSALMTDFLFRDKYVMRSFLNGLLAQPDFSLIES